MNNLIRKTGLLRNLALVLVFTFSFMAIAAEPVDASLKHVVLGGLVGAGAVLAWPTISAALGMAAGAVGSVAAGIGGAVVAGVGAASGAVAAGGALVGGAVAGGGAALGAGVTGVFGAVGGAIAAVTASPLFVPALLIAGAIVIFMIWKSRRGKPLFGRKPTAGFYNPSFVGASNTGSFAPAINPSVSSAPVASAPSALSAASISSSAPAIATSTVVASPGLIRASEGTTAERKPDVMSTSSANAPAGDSASLNSAHDKYVAAYKNYINLLSSGKSSDDPGVQGALNQYKSAFDDYQKLLKSNQ